MNYGNSTFLVYGLFCHDLHWLDAHFYRIFGREWSVSNFVFCHYKLFAFSFVENPQMVPVTFMYFVDELSFVRSLMLFRSN